jgi:hypothetical protein
MLRAVPGFIKMLLNLSLIGLKSTYIILGSMLSSYLIRLWKKAFTLCKLMFGFMRRGT